MIYLAPTDKEKYTLIDKFVAAIPLEELNALVEADLVANRLRTATGTSGSTAGPIQTLLDSHNKMETDMMNLRSELMMLRTDIQAIVKAVAKPFDSYSVNEFNNIKSRYGVY